MQIIKGVENYISGASPLYLALGNFDGVHLGHQKLIKDSIAKSSQNKGLSGAFIFDPHPARVINPSNAPKLLVTNERKAELLADLGMDILIYHPFTTDIAHWSPREFVQRILVEQLNVKEVFVGFNHTFGHKGQGDPALLTSLGEEFGFAVNVTQQVTVDDMVVSSSLIRQMLGEGNMEMAAKLLGYNLVIEGMVTGGERRGSSIGFPTANLQFDPELNIPAVGVYAGKVWFEDNYYKAVINIGTKPTFHEEFPLTVEVHIIDFNQSIYGKRLQVSFYHKIRDQIKFNGLEELRAQIARDRDEAANRIVLP